MLPRIQQLPHSVITKIAAGEVIERPASVVKELLENSVDAGSTRIEIDLEQGGTESIRIVDDGCGIDPADLPLAFASHATSKLHDADDLFRIHSMGFRGEALASIGGVARVTLQSRARGHDVGAEVQCHGAVLSEVRPWNGAPGTRIEVKHLFFNTPVRKKFLRAVATELGHVCETVTRIALAFPTLHLVLRHNGRQVYEIPSSADLRERIALFFGTDVRDALFPIENIHGPARLHGYIADPACDRGTAKLQYLFLNHRWIRDRSISHAIQEAYRGLLMTGRYAVAFLYLTLPPDLVDVNVHPTKSEVRFRDAQAIYHLVRSSVRNRLNDEALIPQLQSPQPEDQELFRQPAVTEAAGDATPTLFAGPRYEQAARVVAPWDMAPPTCPSVPKTNTVNREVPVTASTPLPPSKDDPVPQANPQHDFPKPELPEKSGGVPAPVIQIHDSYLVMETSEGMLVIDQHALHERILFEQLRQRVRSGQLEIQRLLIPEPIDLLPAQAAAVLEAREALLELGLEVEDFGGNTVLLSSYPTLLQRVSPSTILKSVVDILTAKERPPSKEEFLHHLIATMACKAAVKAGDRLTTEEIDFLMHLRTLAEDSHHCPHGRPTSLLFSRQELDKQFRRT